MAQNFADGFKRGFSLICVHLVNLWLMQFPQSLPLLSEIWYDDLMTIEGQKVRERIQELPLEDLVTLHSQLTMAIYEREDSDGLEPGFWSEIHRRIQQIDVGEVQGVDAFAALAKM